MAEQKASERIHRTALDTDPNLFIVLSSEATHELGDEIAALETKLEECETEIQRLPLPPIEIGDGPTERVSYLLEKLEAMEQSTVCAYCGQRFATDTRNSSVEKHIWLCEKHPLANLVFEIEEKCKDLDYEAQELLRVSGEDVNDPNLKYASALHSAIDAIREVVKYARPSSIPVIAQ